MISKELKLYQRSDSFLWTDEYISKNMLAAHLAIDNDAASRNINTIEKTVEWLIEKLPRKGKVLDLGCGPGLYASMLAQKGYSVTGVDISERSISYAKQKAVEDNLQIEYRCDDYLQGELGRGYDLVVCIYCDFGALTPNEQTILLTKIYDSLNDDGILIFDVFRPGLCNLKQERRDWSYSNRASFWCENPHFILEEEKHFSEQKVWGSRTIVIEKGSNPREYITWDHYYSEDELSQLLERHGYHLLTVNNHLIAENDFTSNDVMFIEAKKRKSSISR